MQESYDFAFENYRLEQLCEQFLTGPLSTGKSCSMAWLLKIDSTQPPSSFRTLILKLWMRRVLKPLCSPFWMT
ncbi:hypothetical protein [Pseudomonas sp. MBLB4136]|uniref:hypothetical protein n=1 Tax=Pseudomonas sp. MBLB4136 TaxID=3451558 RepID=UPI003F7542CD